MSINKVLKEQIENMKVDEDSLFSLKELTKEFTSALSKELRKGKANAEVFVGGSFAKGTLLRKYDYDIDVFVRFDWKYDDISNMLESVLNKICKRVDLTLERLHGSRDYFRVRLKGKNIYFEVIPVTMIKKPREERNVTDLSYFHVPYVKRKIRGKEDDLRLAKTFCHAQKVYGAETYVGGFSGYALECLIIYYGSFAKMLRELSKIKLGERLVIDVEKHYKRKNDVYFELNENRLHSPVILIDPIYKERNALASLRHETFDKFQKSAKEFLKSPSIKHFVEKPINVEGLRKKAKTKKAEFLQLQIKTSKQAGDIAGTKLKKFSEVLEREIGRYFKVSDVEFDYGNKQSANVYLAAKSRKEVVRIGPPLHLRKHVTRFKREHRTTFEKTKFIHARIKVNFKAAAFVDVWKKQRANRKMMGEMGITGLRVLD